MICCFFRSRAVVPTLPTAVVGGFSHAAEWLLGLQIRPTRCLLACIIAWNIPFGLGNEILGTLDRLSIG
jgi:hypothetical protein